MGLNGGSDNRAIAIPLKLAGSFDIEPAVASVTEVALLVINPSAYLLQIDYKTKEEIQFVSNSRAIAES